LRKPGGIGEDCTKIFWLKFWIIYENLRFGRSGTEQFQKRLDGIS